MNKAITSFVIFFIFCFGFSSCSEKNNSSRSEENKSTTEDIVSAPDSLLRHVVLFKFKESSSDNDVKKIEDAFSALPSKIKEIYSYEWGINNSPEGLDKGFTHCFFVTFQSEEDRSVYLPHPDHLEFVALLGPHLDDVLVIDYWND